LPFAAFTGINISEYSGKRNKRTKLLCSRIYCNNKSNILYLVKAKFTAFLSTKTKEYPLI